MKKILSKKELERANYLHKNRDINPKEAELYIKSLMKRHGANESDYYDSETGEIYFGGAPKWVI